MQLQKDAPEFLSKRADTAPLSAEPTPSFLPPPLTEKLNTEDPPLDRTGITPTPSETLLAGGPSDVNSDPKKADQPSASSPSTGPIGAGPATISDKEVAPRDLVIGSNISFLGEINTCRRLVVDGNAEVKLDRCDEIRIGETGVLKGQILAEIVDVHGRMEGDITVRKRLLIRANGQVCGTVTYGEIEIEKGGRVIGTATVRDHWR